MGSLLHTGAKTRPRCVGGCHCLSLNKASPENILEKVILGGCWALGLSQPALGLRDGASVPFLTQTKMSVLTWSTGMLLCDTWSSGERSVSEKVSYMHNKSVSPSVYAVNYRHLFVVFGGGWCPGGQWGHFTGFLGQMLVTPHFRIAGLLWPGDILGLLHHVLEF